MHSVIMLEKELVAASTEPLILSLLSQGESYGYALIQEVKRLSEDKIEWTDGMLYPVLRRMGFLGMLKGFLMGTRSPELPDVIAFTAEAQQSLQLARAEAPRLNHDFIGTEHVLLGLLNSQSGIVSNVMRRLGVECAAVRAEIEK